MTTCCSRWRRRRWPWGPRWRRLRPGRIGDDHAALPPKVGPSSHSPTVGSLFAAWRAIQPVGALGRERLAACGARPSSRMLVSLRPVSGVLNPFAAVGRASDDRSPIPSCQSCQIDDRPPAAIAWLSSSVPTGRRNPTLVALLLAFPAHVNDPRIWRGQPSNLIHGLTIAEFATTCGTLHALPIGKWLETEHFLIGNAGNSKQSAPRASGPPKSHRRPSYRLGEAFRP